MPHASRFAFTLVEIMVVCAIIGIVMTMSIPMLYRKLYPDSMDKVASDVMEACAHGRAFAILNGFPMDLVFRAEDGQISLQPGSGPRPPSDSGPVSQEPFSPSVSGGDWRMGDRSSSSQSSAPANCSFTAKIPDTIGIELLEVNFQDAMEWAEARVRFYPNGTSDEFKMLLFRPASGERRLITLEVVTGLADLESDLSRMR